MANVEITNIDLGSVIFESGEFRDGLLTFAGEGVVLSGTILARDSVSGNFVPYVIDGVANENGIPKAVLTYDVAAEAAGDIAIRAMVSGKVRTQRLIVDADGDDSNITEEVLEQLRDYSLVAVDVQELGRFDNQ